MGGGVNKAGGRIEHLGRNHVCPKLQRNLELLVDRNSLGRFNRTVSSFGHVVQFTQTCVAGACVVPGVGAFLSNLSEALINLDAPVGLQLLNQSAEGGTHDSATN